MDRVRLAKYLEVGLPSQFDLTFQTIEGELDDDPVICCWADDELEYIVSADDQPGGLSADAYWESLDRCLRTHPDMTAVKLVTSGAYATDLALPVTYRIYQLRSAGEDEFHVYHLVADSHIAYWVLATLPALAGIFIINSGVTAIVRTARLTAHRLVEC